jgi:hypothetical protein
MVYNMSQYVAIYPLAVNVASRPRSSPFAGSSDALQRVANEIDSTDRQRGIVAAFTEPPPVHGRRSRRRCARRSSTGAESRGRQAWRRYRRGRRQGEPSGMGCGPNAAKTMPFSGSGFGLGETTGHPPMGFRALPEIVGRLGRGTIDESKTTDTDQSDAHARSCCPAGVRRAGGHFAGA